MSRDFLTVIRTVDKASALATIYINPQQTILREEKLAENVFMIHGKNISDNHEWKLRLEIIDQK